MQNQTNYYIKIITNIYKTSNQTIHPNMNNQLTNRSHNNSLKYITPRKTAVKHKKIHIQLPDLPIYNNHNHHQNNENQHINYNYNTNSNTNTNSYNNSHTRSQSTHKLNQTISIQQQPSQYLPQHISISNTSRKQQKQLKITDFEILKQMGRGKFGYVYAAKQKQTDYLVAIKKMSKKQLKDNDFQQQVKRQIIIQASLNHKNILKLFGYFWDSQYVYLILQYAPQGQLFNILQKFKTIPEQQVSIIIKQVCQGLQYLHSHSIIHRDIKPQNILVSDNIIKIGDFGWSIHSQTRRQTLCGTLDYLAPEIVKGLTHDNSIDIWQIGILAYQLAVGHPPFQTSNNQQTYVKIVNQEVQFPSHVSYQLKNFIRKILQKNPNKRMTCSQVLKQPFIVKYGHNQLNLRNP